MEIIKLYFTSFMPYSGVNPVNSFLFSKQKIVTFTKIKTGMCM